MKKYFPQKKSLSLIGNGFNFAFFSYLREIYGNLISLLTTLKGLPMTYSKDLQEDSERIRLQSTHCAPHDQGSVDVLGYV